ncbi:hypothetical protein DCC81_12780 [Chitinophaga parva]|uniref:Uncharacterized protein n=1 Tax=Chitinophaga parva TaxID=2169414 RepID=A0A2T7BFX0_9BACT|nr:hypothetical protein [Chitinophaga parva]PUZ25177.1 hypothetical protein DCC81_12780 [Chitinophaga parva]
MTFSVVPYPNTPVIGAIFKSDSIPTGLVGKLLPAGVAGKLQVFDLDADTLIADTLIMVPKDGQLDFKFVYATDIGISGFLNTQPYAPDTAYFNFQNSVKIDGAKVPVDVKVSVMNNTTGEFEELFTLENLAPGKLSATYSLPGFDASGNSNNYFAEVLNADTKAALSPGPVFVGAGGSFFIDQLYTDIDGMVYPNYISF